MGRREGWVIAWDSTLKLVWYVSPVRHRSCILNSAVVVVVCELFHGECLWGKLSMEDVPGF